MRKPAARRAEFDQELTDLQNDLLMLGSMVEKAVARSIDALRLRDLAASEQIVKDDNLIDAKRFAIEERCIDLIARQQPLAGDLRQLVSFLQIAVELERMGDYAEGIAKISLMMGEQPPLKPLVDIPRMSDIATGMLRRSLDALVERDVEAALNVCDADDEVDQLYNQVYNELLIFMLRDPQTIERATYLLWTSHNLERVADRATNVAERVVYLVTGRMTDARASRY